MPSGVSLSAVSSARNLSVIFDATLSMYDHISAISKSCFSHIRDLRRIRNTLDLTTAKTIATSLVHSRLDYCNSLFLNLPSSQLNRLQLILNSAARAVAKHHKFHHVSPLLKSFHWLKINQRIQYKILSLTCKTLQSQQPVYLFSRLALQTKTKTRSSTAVTLLRPTVTSRLKLTNRSFTHYAPALWNTLPLEMRQPTSSTHPPNTSNMPILALSSSQIHNRLKTFIFLILLSLLYMLDGYSGFRPGFHSSHLHYQSLTFIIVHFAFLFTAELIQCLRVSHLNLTFTGT